METLHFPLTLGKGDFTNEGTLKNGQKLTIKNGSLTNTGTIGDTGTIEIGGDLNNSGTISNTLNVRGSVFLNAGSSISGTINAINNNSKFMNKFTVTETQDLQNVSITGKFDFNIADSKALTITNLTNNDSAEISSEIHLRTGTLIVPTYTGSGDIYLFKGSNLTITNYAGTGTIYLQEGATLTIENGVTIPNIVIQTTTDKTDYATISTNGNLTISNATYNNADIKTKGNITLPETTVTTNEIGNLNVASGTTSIETINANSISVETSASLKVSSSITSQSIANNGSINGLASVSTKGLENSGVIEIEGNFTCDGVVNSSGILKAKEIKLGNSSTEDTVTIGKKENDVMKTLKKREKSKKKRKITFMFRN